MEPAGFIQAPCVSHTVNQDRSFTHLTRMRHPATGVPSAAASDGACDRGTAFVIEKVVSDKATKPQKFWYEFTVYLFIRLAGTKLHVHATTRVH